MAFRISGLGARVGAALICAAASLVTVETASADVMTFNPQGGPGGQEEAPMQCADGSFMVGFTLQSGDFVDGVGPMCRHFGAKGGDAKPKYFVTQGGSTGLSSEVQCDDVNEAITGIRFNMTRDADDASKPAFVDQIEATCAPVFPRAGAPQPSVIDVLTGESGFVDALFGTGGAPFQQDQQPCPPGMIAAGLRVRSGAYVDAMGLICASAPTVAVAMASGKLPPNSEAGVDRPGFDASYQDLTAADSNLCAKACQDSSACHSWVYVEPGLRGVLARCYLKTTVPQTVGDNCCISGVKIPPRAFVGKDQVGSDVAAEDLQMDDPTLCAEKCDEKNGCVAWTLLKSGFSAHHVPQCYLKGAKPAMVSNDCCISGTKADPVDIAKGGFGELVASQGASSALSPSPSPGINFSGHWNTTDYAGKPFAMQLLQDAKGYVTGNYTGGVIFDGVVIGSQLHATWQEGNAKGRLLFTFYPGGFSGRYNNKLTAEANNKDKGWNGQFAGP